MAGATRVQVNVVFIVVTTGVTFGCNNEGQCYNLAHV